MAEPIPNIKDTKELNKELGLIESTLTSISILLTDKIQQAFEEVEGSAKTISEVYSKNLEKSIKAMSRNSDALLKNTIGIIAGQSKSKDIEKQLVNLDAQRAAQLRNIQALKDEGLISDMEVNRLQDDLKEQYKAQLGILTSQKKLTEDIAKKIGLTGKLLGEANKIPLIGKFIDSEIALTKMNAEAAKLGSTKFSVLLEGLKSIGGSLVKNITDPLTVFTFLATQINKADKQATELAKSLGLSKEQAFGLRQEFVKYSREVGDNFVNVDRLTKAQADLTEQLGFSVKFSSKTAEDFARLTELVGLTAQEAGNLSKFSLASNREISSYTGKLLKGAFYAQNATKSHFSAKQILQDVSKLSSGILVKFQGNPIALGQAVAQAKALGTSLEAMDKSAESLLNFESSIENELKAELLTGRQLNLERARYAALTGDQVALTKEIADQAGTLQDFQSMNVLAQKSLAEAFGLSKDELADMLMKQEAINSYGDKAKELNAQQIKDFEKQKKLNENLTLEDYLNQQAQQLSVQEKFNNAVLKLQDLFGNLFAGPLGNFVDLLSKSLNIVNKIGNALSFLATPLKLIASLYLGIKTTQITLNALRAIETGILIKQAATEQGKLSIQNLQFLLGKQSYGVKLAAYAISLKDIIAEKASNAAKAIGNVLEGKGLLKSIGSAVMGAIGAIFKGPTAFLGPFAVPLALAAGATVGAVGYKFLTGDDVMSEGGYGKRTLLAPEGAIKLNDNDTVIAGTNLGGGGSSIDLTPMINAINEVRTAVASLANRPINTNISIDGKAIGTAVGKQMETGTAQMQYSSYKIA